MRTAMPAAGSMGAEDLVATLQLRRDSVDAARMHERENIHPLAVAAAHEQHLQVVSIPEGPAADAVVNDPAMLTSIAEGLANWSRPEHSREPLGLTA